MFANNKKGTPVQKSYIRLGTVQFTKNGEVIKNLIPFLDSNGKPCMYDTVSKQPYYNQGTGEFLYGYDYSSEETYAPSLPREYTPVEYLESTGTQIIVSNISPSNNTTFYGEFQLVTIEGLSNGYIFGYYGPANTRYRPMGYVNTYFSIQNRNASVVYQKNSDLDRHTVLYNDNNGDCYFDNQKVGSSVALTTPTNNVGLGLFGQAQVTSNGGIYEPNSLVKAKIFRVKAWNKTTHELIAYYIPALDPQGRPCMYDTVTKQPFYNAGTGEFLYGLKE